MGWNYKDNPMKPHCSILIPWLEFKFLFIKLDIYKSQDQTKLIILLTAFRFLEFNVIFPQSFFGVSFARISSPVWYDYELKSSEVKCDRGEFGLRRYHGIGFLILGFLFCSCLYKNYSAFLILSQFNSKVLG